MWLAPCFVPGWCGRVVRKFGRCSRRAAGQPESPRSGGDSAADRGWLCAPEESARPCLSGLKGPSSFHCRMANQGSGRGHRCAAIGLFPQSCGGSDRSEAESNAEKSQGHTQFSCDLINSPGECGALVCTGRRAKFQRFFSQFR